MTTDTHPITKAEKFEPPVLIKLLLFLCCLALLLFLFVFSALAGIFSPHTDPRPLATRFDAMHGLFNKWKSNNSDVTYHVSITEHEQPFRALGHMSVLGGNFTTVLITMDRMEPKERCLEYGITFVRKGYDWVCLYPRVKNMFKNTHMYFYILKNMKTKYLLHVDSDVIAMSANLPGWIEKAKKLLDEGAAAVQMAKCLARPRTGLSLRVFMVAKNSTKSWFPVRNRFIHIEDIFNSAKERSNTTTPTINYKYGCYY